MITVRRTRRVDPASGRPSPSGCDQRSSRGPQKSWGRGAAASFPSLIHSHMLRHSCGYKLANDGHDTRAIQHYLGHRSIASMVRHTALAPDWYKGFWKD